MKEFTKDDIIAALKTVFDPEIPVNVWDLGLIYDISETSNQKPVTRKDAGIDNLVTGHWPLVTKRAIANELGS